MPLDPQAAAELARKYTAAWNSGSPERVASHYAEDGQIVINCGEPWQGRARIADMDADYFLDEKLQVQVSRGWYDADDYGRQVAGA